MSKQKTIFIICSVRNADQKTKEKLEAYKRHLEKQGYKVYLPHMDTNQETSVYEICMQNMQAILEGNEVHIFFDPDSKGSHFDLGVTFLACYMDAKKIIKVIENLDIMDEVGQYKILFFKSFGQMIEEWEERQQAQILVCKN